MAWQANICLLSKIQLVALLEMWIIVSTAATQAGKTGQGVADIAIDGCRIPSSVWVNFTPASERATSSNDLLETRNNSSLKKTSYKSNRVADCIAGKGAIQPVFKDFVCRLKLGNHHGARKIQTSAKIVRAEGKAVPLFKTRITETFASAAPQPPSRSTGSAAGNAVKATGALIISVAVTFITSLWLEKK